MRSVKSWFNPTLFQKNLTRFWPIWVVYLVIWLFLFPINLILDNYSSPSRFAYYNVLEHVGEVGLPLAVVFSLLAAVAVWSYLFNNRSACLMHTLPVRREGLFLTNFLSGMAFLVGPNLVVFVLTLLAELPYGYVDVGNLLVWFFGVSLMELFFFSFATFCAMCTGHILGMPALYGVFNVLVAGLVALIDLVLSRFVFGYTNVEGLWVFAEWLTPAWKLSDNLEVRREWVNGEAVDASSWLSGFGYILVYVILGLILAALALVLYRRRHMERAGDVITVTWMRPVFQYGVAFCCALAFGSLLFEIFRGTMDDSAWALLFFMLICGVVGYFIARMLLEKSFRVFRRWKGCLPLLAALVLLVCAMEFDLTGFERHVPGQDEVASVRLSSIDTVPYDEASWLDLDTEDPQLIQAALAIHKAIVEDKYAIENQLVGGVDYQNLMPEGYSVTNRTWGNFDVTYRLKNGKSVRRAYSGIPLLASDLNDPDSVAAKLDALVNLPQVIEEAYGLTDESAESVIDMTLSHFVITEEGYGDMQQVAVSKEAQKKIFEAVMADFAEGNLGRRYLMDDAERMSNCFVNDLEITFYRSEAKRIVEYTEYGEVITDTPASSKYNETITVALQTTAKHTLAALKQVGVVETPVNLMTQAQYEMAHTEHDRNQQSWAGIDLGDFAWVKIGDN